MQQSIHLREGRFAWPINWLISSLFLVFVLVTLPACGGGSSGTQQGSGGTVTLRYALWQESEMPGYKQSIQEFEKLHPNIKVNIEQTPWMQYWQKLTTQFAGGSAPDVFWDHVAYFAQYVSQGQLMDLTPLIEKDKIDTSVYYPNLLTQFVYQDKTYGLPKDWDTIALFYNKDMLKKAGIDAPTNLTWNPTDGGTFLKLAQKLTLDKKGLHPDQPGFDPNNIAQYGFVSANVSQELYFDFIAMNGGQLLDKPFGQHFQLNKPEAVQALQFLVDLSTKYHVSPPATETNEKDGIMAQLFSQSKVAMTTAGSWNTTYIASQVNFPFGITRLPAGPQGVVSVFNGLSDGIYAKTQHPQEAWELVKWLASPESQRIVGSGGYVWPAVKSAAPLYAQYWIKKGLQVDAFLEESQGKTISFPITLGFGEAFTKINNEFDLMFLGQVPVQQATDTAVQQGDSALAAAAP